MNDLNRNSQIIYEAICEGIAARTSNNKSMGEVCQVVYNKIKELDVVSPKIYCESPEYSVPEYSYSNEDACMDLRVRWIEKKLDRIVCHTGIHIELPKNYQLNILS